MTFMPVKTTPIALHKFCGNVDKIIDYLKVVSSIEIQYSLKDEDLWI